VFTTSNGSCSQLIPGGTVHSPLIDDLDVSAEPVAVLGQSCGTGASPRLVIREVDGFDLAREIRGLDMRAAPSDLRDLGYDAVRIETPGGKAQYAAEQRVFSRRSQALRARLVGAIDHTLISSTGRPD
jgi:hypothetical protein